MAGLRHGCARKGARTPEYRAWTTMLTRCHNPNADAYAYYGGRGITVCRRWRRSFAAFLADVGPRPGPGFTLERIKNRRGYTPGNVTWATWDEQRRNTRRTRLLTLDGRTMPLCDWAAARRIKVSTITKRLDALGWPVRLALTVRPRPGAQVVKLHSGRPVRCPAG